MKKINKNSKKALAAGNIILILALAIFWSAPTSAHLVPAGCTGSGLGINLFTNLPQVNIGDTVSYSVVIFNGTGIGPVVCDATEITASLVTPDGVNHPLTLTRTSLSNGQADTYLNVVTYVARAQDITPQGTLTATASDTGVIHQNITDSVGGGNQGLNVFVLNTLHVVKLVVNDNGGTAVASDFNIHVKNAGVDVAGSPALGTGAPGTLFSIISGTYTVSEDANTSYTQSFSGDCDANGNVTLLGAQDKTCTITNNDIAPATITVVKTVINDNGGSATVESFPLFVGETSVVSGVANTFAAPGTYTVSETTSTGYTRTFSGDCDANGTVTLVPGDNKVCTITNNDIPPEVTTGTITVNKVVINDNGGSATVESFPLFVGETSVVSGVSNTFPAPGTYAVTETTSTGYTMTFSGDCDANGTVTLVPGDSQVCTITNDDVPPVTPPPPGGGGGGSTGGGGTTVPGLPNTGSVSPAINVIKVPSVLTLPIGGGMVTYTYTLTNPGPIALSNVTLTDNMCSQIVWQSGDVNNNNMLDVSESWVYNCSTNLTSTTTNTAVASGEANGQRVSDLAVSTITATAPALPDTGTAPARNNVPWSIAILAIIMLISTSPIVLRKRST